METEFSQILLNQARSTTPSTIAIPLIALILVILFARLLVVRSGRPALLLSAILTAAVLIVLLRDPWVQQIFARLNMNLATVRVIAHTTIMFAAAIAWLLARAWRTSRKFPPYELFLVFGGATSLSAWLWWVSAPARAQNVAVEDFESWRTAAYLVPVSTPIPIACVALILASVAHARERKAWRTWVWVGATVTAAGLQAFDHITRAISGIYLSLGTHNLLTSIRTEGVDQIFLPAVAALALCTIPGIWNTAQIRAGLVAIESDIQPMWSAITRHLPGITKPETSSLPLQSRVEEMFIEIEDGLVRLSLPTNCKSPEDGAVHVEEALHAYIDDGELANEIPTWVADRTAIRRTAAAFKRLPHSPPVLTERLQLDSPPPPFLWHSDETVAPEVQR